MKRLQVAVICVIAALVMVGATFTLWRRPPIIYQGKTLSQWLIEANSGSWPRRGFVPADEAIRHIGTNAFPMVARLLQCHDSTLKCKLLALYYRQSLIHIHIPTQNDHHARAWAACKALGSDAKPLVPAVAKAFKHMDPNVRHAFELWLEGLGPDADAAVPALIQLLEDKRNPDRQTIPLTLGRIGMHRRREVRAALAACRQDTDEVVRVLAEDALTELAAPQQSTTTKMLKERRLLELMGTEPAPIP